MELKDLQSDLEALRVLYGLLQCGGDVASNVVLGERSKFLLKELLDGATERVLETHKKIIAAAEHGVCGTSCSSESEQCRAVPEFQPSVSPSIKAAAGLTTESNHHVFSSQKDENSPNNLTIHEVISQESRLSFSLDKPENRRKCWELSKQGSIKQQSRARILSKDSKPQAQHCDSLGHFYQASQDERKLLERNKKGMKLLKRNETIGQKSICGFQGTPSIVRSVAGSSRSLASGNNLANQNERKGEAANNFSKDVDNVVKHIESHISALRLCSKLADATKVAAPDGLGNLPTPVSPMVQAKEHLVKNSEISHGVEPFSDRNELQLIGVESQRIGKKGDSAGSHQVLSQSENDMLDEITSKKRRIQQTETGQTYKPIIERSNNRLIKRVSNRNENGRVEADGHKQSQTSSCYVHGLRVPIKRDDITKKPPMPVKMPSPVPVNNMGKISTPKIAKLKPQIPSQSAGSRASVRLISDKKALVNQQESDDSSTAGSGSSTDSEAYSSPSQDSSASISRRFAHRSVYENRSSSSTRSSSDFRDVGESGRKVQKAIRAVNSEPGKAVGKVGRLRRFKNKLGLIFHHHHHHHHHRYDHDNSGGDHSRGTTPAVQTKSTWTHLHKLFHHRNIHEVDGKHKPRKANVAIKHEVGHFHALVEGLMRHLRHSKKSKASKGGTRKLGNGHKNRRVKQLHWWQMFQRQRGVKLPNTRRAKMRFISKRRQQQQLRGPKLR